MTFLRKNAVPLMLALMFNKEILQMLFNVRLGSGLSKLLVWGMIVMLYILAWRNTPGMIERHDVVLMTGWAALLVVSLMLLTREEGTYTLLVLKTIAKGAIMFFAGKMIIQNREGDLSGILSFCPALASVLSMLLLRTMLDAMSVEMVYGEGMDYSQSLGYSMLASACIALFLASKGQVWQIPFAGILTYGIFTAGARGPLACVFAAIAISMISTMDLRSLRFWFILVMSSLAGIFLAQNYTEILIRILAVLRATPFSTRVVRTLMEGTFSSTSNRTGVYLAAIRGIDEYLFTGTGIFRDRQYIFDHLKELVVSNSSTGCYAHSIILELLLQFGILIGGGGINLLHDTSLSELHNLP